MNRGDGKILGSRQRPLFIHSLYERGGSLSIMVVTALSWFKNYITIPFRTTDVHDFSFLHRFSNFSNPLHTAFQTAL
jgi:hypothetical protein